jgi:hypothetical protein
MPIVSPPCCPVCEVPIDVEDLRREVLRRSSPADGTPWGIRCSNCQTLLKVVRWPTYFAFAALFAGCAGMLVWLRDRAYLSDGLMLGIALLMLLPIAVISALWIPLFARVRLPDLGERTVVAQSLEENLENQPERALPDEVIRPAGYVEGNGDK